MSKTVEGAGLLVECDDGTWALVIQSDGVEIDRLTFETEAEATRAFDDFKLLIVAAKGRTVH